jgi:membrane-bound lytic murein transglycosylase D
MNRRRALLLLGLSSGGVLAQDETMTLDDLLGAGQQWLEENVDEGVLKALGEVDETEARRLLGEFQKRFQGEYVLDLARLRGTAETVAPLLRRFRATARYADWFQTRLDYFRVAERLRVIVPPPPGQPGKPTPPAPKPTPEQERRVWREQVATRPPPKGADAYVKRLKPEFTARKVPAQLVWLAEVESSFNPQAQSPAGAAGLYQLMPATAKSQGLSLSPTDERFDAEKNAGAAAKYLRYLHGRFKDWPLALAAYNCGEGRLANALTKHKARTFDQVANHLPAETQMYVPKFEAVLSRREGVALAKLPSPA